MSLQTLPTTDDLADAEQELSRQELELDAEVTRLKGLRKQATDYLSRMKQQGEDPALVTALGALAVPSASVRAQVDEARMARLKALTVRKSCLDTARQVLEAHELELGALAERVRCEEAASKQRSVQRSAVTDAQRRGAQAKAHARIEAMARGQAMIDHEPVEVESMEETMVRAVSEVTPPAPPPQAKPPLQPKPAGQSQQPGQPKQVAQPKQLQRRATPRAQLCAEISVGSDSNFFVGFTNDVSEGGLFVATVNLLPLGTQIDLAFSLPNGPRIEGKGEVCWVREHDERNPEVFPGMGVRFVDIPLESVAAIHAFTEHREPMFFPE